MLCGQFLPAVEGGTAEWTSFVTIKTSDYEQWMGIKLWASANAHRSYGTRWAICRPPCRHDALLCDSGCQTPSTAIAAAC
jgi:hypothetical protein